MTQFQRHKLAHHGSFEFFCRRRPRRRQSFCRFQKRFVCCGNRDFGGFQFAAAAINAIELVLKIKQHTRQLVSRYRIFAGQRAQGKKPFFFSFQIAGINLQPGEQRFQFVPRFFNQGKGLFQPGFGRGGGGARFFAHARKPFQRRCNRCFARFVAAQKFDGRGDIFANLAGIHQKRALGRQYFFLAHFGAKSRKLLYRMAHKIGIGGGLFGGAAQSLQRGARRGQIGKPRCHIASQLFVAAKRIQQTAMGRVVIKPAIIALPVNFHQLPAQITQQRNAHRFVIDKGAGAPIRRYGAAQDNLVITGNAVFVRQHAGAVRGRQIEYGGGRTLRRAGAY